MATYGAGKRLDRDLGGVVDDFPAVTFRGDSRLFYGGERPSSNVVPRRTLMWVQDVPLPKCGFKTYLGGG